MINPFAGLTIRDHGQTIDATGIHDQPETDHEQYQALLAVIFDDHTRAWADAALWETSDIDDDPTVQAWAAAAQAEHNDNSPR